MSPFDTSSIQVHKRTSLGFFPDADVCQESEWSYDDFFLSWKHVSISAVCEGICEGWWSISGTASYFLRVFWGSTSDPPACLANTLPTGPKLMTKIGSLHLAQPLWCGDLKENGSFFPVGYRRGSPNPSSISLASAFPPADARLLSGDTAASCGSSLLSAWNLWLWSQMLMTKRPQ